ncbi:MAG TPA: putative Ig domain-containing protein, partial [Candidatus Eisenbacteria bacterium]|nr:putative Ig domain-containing protein [Candidatus Eisenbacteria bacterium]
MKFGFRHLILSALLLLAFATNAKAQYLWMDTNGDGVNTSADVMSPNGTGTTVDVWLNTAHNKDGSAAVCKSGDPDATLQTWNSFATHINATGGTVTYTGYTNQVAAFTITCSNGGVAFNANTTEMAQCQATGTPVGNGGVNIKLFTVTVTGQTGTPSLAFVPTNTLDNNPTSFGSPCGGLDFDNTIKLGTDFLDADGIGPAAGGNASPVISAPTTATGTEGQVFTLSATATDADAADNLSLTATGQPASLTLTPGSGVSPVTATLNGTLGFGDQGNYSIVWSVTDGHNPAVTATTNLTVTNVDRAPAVTAPATASGAENTLITYTVSAADPDGDAILSLTAAPLPTGATFTANATKTAGTFSWTPSFSQSGSYNVTTTATNALSGSATTAITVTNVDRAPTVAAPATASGASNSLITFTVTASDPDADPITSLTAAPLPTGATFTDNATHTSGTFSWTPTNAQTGTTNVTFTAANALTGSATTAITVTSGDRPPAVTAPATASGNENTLITFTVTASDPDGDPIASLVAAPLPSGATFTANGSNTSGTFSWTPSFTQSGSYNVTFTATNALGGSATTAITVNNVDRAPAVTAPATASGAENTLITFTVTASDPDGDAITSLTGAPLPSGATFTANGSNTSGTFSWTPSFTQSGSYNVTFTASNALNGTATTAITVTNSDRAPVVTAPPTASGQVGVLLTFTVSASDPDGDAITSLSGAPLPSGATFTANGTNTAGTFSWTPTTGQAGNYSVTFTAANALTGSATTAITIAPPGDAPPQVSAPPTASGDENTLITFTVTASDPDADPIASLTAAPLPSGATFTANATNTAGTFSWTPSFSQSGSYNVTFTATNALTGSATTAITVNNVDRAPTVTAPATASGDEGTLITFTVTATDPDGDAITSLTGAPLPSGATFTANASNTSGTFNWTPSATQSGVYTVTFTAQNALSGSGSTEITVNNVDAAPVVTAPATQSGPEGTTITFTVSATDPDGDMIVSLTGSPIPAGATFTVTGEGTPTATGTFSWPNATPVGSYPITFTASNVLTGTATTVVNV